MQRNDIVIKKILRENNIPLVKFGGHKNAPRVIERGVYVFQTHGIVSVQFGYSDGVDKEKVKEMLLADKRTEEVELFF